jgi:hypothetical protein
MHVIRDCEARRAEAMTIIFELIVELIIIKLNIEIFKLKKGISKFV